jgi:hypothetical protein
MPQQVPRMPGIFRDNEINRLQDIERAQGDVIEVANRCADDIKHGELIGATAAARQPRRRIEQISA